MDFDTNEYYAHKRSDGTLQTVKLHLEDTATLAKNYAVDIIKPLAYEVGLLHDIGKYAKTFQERLNGSSKKYEHSSCGAIEVDNVAKGKSIPIQIVARMIEYCIAGHHTGLPDGGNQRDMFNSDEQATLYAKLGRFENYVDKDDYSIYKRDISIEIPECKDLLSYICGIEDKAEVIERYAFFTRYLFSCLTDADFLDTERFCNEEIRQHFCLDIKSAERTLNNILHSKSAHTALQKARGRLQEQAYSRIDMTNEISILNMPTGSGKTLGSLNIALKMIAASKGKLKRIIYVIPYTSIIEQTAEIFDGIFGDDTMILQHHSNYDYEFSSDDGEEYDAERKLKKAAENWDAPVIVTTSVQFFESLYHYKGSRLRKLHNLSDSVIVFDEIHLLPIKMLQPCLRAVGYVTKYLNAKALFLSATMPDYTNLFQKYLHDCKVGQLITDRTDFSYFKKCTYTNLGSLSYESVVEKVSKYGSALIIVNTRKAAREVYNMLSGNKYHLSTYMTPFDRSGIIEKIKLDLATHKPTVVVSTSLVEAGVDLDFEVVFRELAGLDNILQAGGRCNREGLRDNGDVFIFDANGSYSGDFNRRVVVTKDLLNTFADITMPECVEEYYRRIFELGEKQTDENTISKDCNGIDNIPFRTYAKSFNMINEDNVGVVIPSQGDARTLIEQLKNGNRSAKRKLQKYTVSLKVHEFSEALKQGIVNDFDTGVFILTDSRHYVPDTGLDIC